MKLYLALSIATLAVVAGVVDVNASVISGGWATWTPYQYQERLPTGGRQLTGLDIEVMNAAAELAGLNPIYQEIVWDRHLRSIEAGNLDFAMGATRQAAREEYAWFSRPYRHEAIFVFCRKGEGALWEGDSPIDTLKAIRDRGGKISLEAGSFFGQEVSDLIAEPAEASWVDTHPTTAQVLQALLHGEVDAVLMDRFAGLSAAWNQDVLDELEELSGPVHVSPISMMFSKATVSPETVASFDAAIAELEQSGRLRYFARHTLIPSLLVITLGSTWFFILEMVGTAAFAISGVLIARKENYDIIGAAVLAFLPALGGGIMRDVVSDRSPIGILRSPAPVFVVIATVVCGYVFFRIADLMKKQVAEPRRGRWVRWFSADGLFQVTDAIGLSSFTVIGVMVAIDERCDPIWLWGPFMACLTGAGGGILRDILRARSDISTLKGSVYPEIALVGGLAYTLLLVGRTSSINLSYVQTVTLATLAATFLIRLLVVHFGIHSVTMGITGKPDSGK